MFQKEYQNILQTFNQKKKSLSAVASKKSAKISATFLIYQQPLCKINLFSSRSVFN